MQMFISVTIEAGDIKRDIRIDSEQKIGEGLAVLMQSGKIPNGPAPDYFHSRLNQKPVSAYRTFAEEQIFDGDILSIVSHQASFQSASTVFLPPCDAVKP